MTVRKQTTPIQIGRTREPRWGHSSDCKFPTMTLITSLTSRRLFEIPTMTTLRVFVHTNDTGHQVVRHSLVNEQNLIRNTRRQITLDHLIKTSVTVRTPYRPNLPTVFLKRTASKKPFISKIKLLLASDRHDRPIITTRFMIARATTLRTRKTFQIPSLKMMVWPTISI